MMPFDERKDNEKESKKGERVDLQNVTKRKGFW